MGILDQKNIYSQGTLSRSYLYIKYLYIKGGLKVNEKNCYNDDSDHTDQLIHRGTRK
jgi:hypothetical protein